MAAFLVGLSLWIVLSWWVPRGMWTSSYELLERHETYEVRHYPSLTVARVVITASYNDAITEAMDALHAYRSGFNLKQPIEIITIRGKTTEISQTISASGPFIVEQKAGIVTVSLVLPDEYTPDTAPRPKDPRVLIDTYERQRIAVRTMSGSVNDGTFVKEGQALLEDLRASTLLILSEPRAAYYSPLWVFWPLRQGEVHVRVR
jgi:hypothetical protein